MGRIEELLDERARAGSLRVLRPASQRHEGMIRINGKDLIDLSSNDYLGLSGHPRLKKAACEATERLGTSSCASRLLSGDLDLHHELEDETALFKKKEAALVFNSGYQANLGILASLCGRQDAIYSDRLCHASIIDGVILSQARSFRFRHNDMEHLEPLLKENRKGSKEALIVTESVFSMDGDKAPLRDIAGLARKYDCRILVDEAHATGIFGKDGSGLVEEEGLSDEIDFIMGTFGKALAGFGAYLACSKLVKEYLINTCRSFIYSTALPPSVIACDLESLAVVREEPDRRKVLLENAEYLKKRLKEAGFAVRGESQIIPLMTQDSERAVKMSKSLQDKGYWVMPIRPPTVPKGESRLRFSLSFHHTKEMLDGIKSALGKQDKP